MTSINLDTEEIFSIQDEVHFLELAIRIFKFQHTHNVVYRQFCDQLKTKVDKVQKLEEIPFLPISFFKTHEVYSKIKGDLVFSSSGTTGQITSKHYVLDGDLYKKSFAKAFELFYGEVKSKCILGLLPSYLERDGSSLVYMVNDLIEQSGNERSGFYLNDYEAFCRQAKKAIELGEEVIVFGVSYALMDLAEGLKPDLSKAIVIETGGMKGKREEISKKNLHDILKKGLSLDKVHSEYGMTELLSQAYSLGDEVFSTPPWMKILLRQINDPFAYTTNKTGGINVIDLANIHSCSFIATEDLGRMHGEYFQVLGRSQAADLRGCNLMYDF